jgi:hypothetical protein
MSWTHGELVEALGRYELACIDAGMTEKSVHSYWDYASRFLNWRTGGVSTAGLGPACSPRHLRIRVG